jgi:hypothetical protein
MTNESYTATLNQLHDATDAFDAIERLSRCDCTETLPRTRSCLHDHFTTAIRDLLIDIDFEPTHDDDPTLDAIMTPPDHIYAFARALLNTINDAPYQTQQLSMLRLDYSLCPMHAIDYAICFDDDDAECAQIRACFPDHDT